MNDLAFYLLAAGVALVLLLQLIALLRRARFDTPADLQARLALLEQNLQALTQDSARREAAGERVEQQLRLFPETTAQGFEASRRPLDDKLDNTVHESRIGRREL